MNKTFGGIQAYSPTGNPKMLPITKANIMKFSKYVSSKQQHSRKPAKQESAQSIEEESVSSVESDQFSKHATKTQVSLIDNIKNNTELPLVLNRRKKYSRNRNVKTTETVQLKQAIQQQSKTKT